VRPPVTNVNYAVSPWVVHCRAAFDKWYLSFASRATSWTRPTQRCVAPSTWMPTLDGLNHMQLVGHIEASPGPLARYWRSPDGAKSALCITEDLDALTLLDYAGRLFNR
jgi:hypothetical protein